MNLLILVRTPEGVGHYIIDSVKAEEVMEDDMVEDVADAIDTEDHFFEGDAPLLVHILAQYPHVCLDLPCTVDTFIECATEGGGYG
jgi:hypothetical protein